jgi:O-antigen/teichoic acid export membrane protein
VALRSRIVRGAGLAAAGFFLSRIITFGTYVAITNLITPREAGVFTAGTVVVGMALLFAESGMLGAIIHWRGDVEEAASTAVASTAATGVLLTLLAAAVAPLVGLYFNSSQVGEIAAASAGFLLLRSLAIVPDALLQRRLSFLRRVAVDPLGAAAFAVGTIVAAANGMGAWSLVIGTYALYVLEVLAAWGFVRWRPQRRLMSMATWRKLAGFARHVVASEIVRRVVLQLDTVLLGRFSGAATLGQYSYGMRLASQPSTAFVSVIAYVLFPGFARVAEDRERFRRGFEDALTVMTLISLPVGLILIPLGDQLALLAFGPQWAVAGDVIKALCLVNVGWTWVSICSEAFKSVGRPQLITRIHLVSLIASVVLMPSLLWADGVGIGIAVSAAAMISGLYALWLAADGIGTTLAAMLRAMTGIAVASGLAMAPVAALDLTVFSGGSGRAGAALGVVVEGLAGLVAFLVVLRIVAPADLARLTGLLGGLRRRRPVEA